MPFSDFFGNARIVAALRGTLRGERVPHALLFTGPRGVGKYTLACLFAQAANCQRLPDDSCGQCENCQRIGLLANPQALLEQGLTERGESADAAMVERMPLILQTHPDVWALPPDPVRMRTPVVRPMLRIGQLRAVQRAAYFLPQGRRRVFILDGADTMRWDVASVFLKILEEPPPSATLILIAPSPYSLLPTIVSRCMQFHFAPLQEEEVEALLRAHSSERNAAERKRAAQLCEGSPGRALAMDAEAEAEFRRKALGILEGAARGQGFSQLFADTAALAKNRASSFEEQLSAFYTLLTDLLEVTSGARQTLPRNPSLAKEIQSLGLAVDGRWVELAIEGLDELSAGARRNLNRHLGIDAWVTGLAPAKPGGSATSR